MVDAPAGGLGRGAWPDGRCPRGRKRRARGSAPPRPPPPPPAQGPHPGVTDLQAWRSGALPTSGSAAIWRIRARRCSPPPPRWDGDRGPPPRPAYIGVGNNLADPRAQVLTACSRLAQVPLIRLVLSSRLYRSRPFGPIA